MFLFSFQQVGILIAYIMVGFFLKKKKIVNEHAIKTLSVLLSYLFLPAYCVYNFSKSIDINNIKTYLSFVVAGLVFFFIMLLVSFFLSRLFSKDSYKRKCYIYMLLFPNFGYFGYPIIEAVFGQLVLVKFMIFCLAFSVASTTFGYYMLTNSNQKLAIVCENSEHCCEEEGSPKLMSNEVNKKSIWKSIFSLPTLGTIIGILLGLLPIKKPDILFDLLSPASNCMNACAMILTGIVLAKIPFKKLFSCYKAYILTFVRLIAVPFIVAGILVLFRIKNEMFITLVSFSCLPIGMNAVVFPESVGKDASECAQACFISHAFALVTMPLIFMFIQAIVGI